MGKRRGILLFLFVILLFPIISAGNYGEGSYSVGVYGIGEVPATLTPTPSASSGGGGAGCVYNWVCTNWFPSECPVSGLQERICMNKGTCTGTNEMPNETRVCIYEHKEPLFDIFLTLSSQYQKTCAGQKIKASVKLQNYGKLELLDAFMTYWIIDSNNTLISEIKDTRNVADKLNFDISIKVPDSTPIGTYRLYAQITYSGNKTAVAGQSFEINDEMTCKAVISNYIPFILILLGFIILLVLIIILFKKIKVHLKENTYRKRKIVKKEKKKIGFFERIGLNRERVRKEKEKNKFLKEIIKQKKEAERENNLLKMRMQREYEERLQEKKQRKFQKEYRKKSKEEKKTKIGLHFPIKKTKLIPPSKKFIIENKWRKIKLEELKKKLHK